MRHSLLSSLAAVFCATCTLAALTACSNVKYINVPSSELPTTTTVLRNDTTTAATEAMNQTAAPTETTQITQPDVVVNLNETHSPGINYFVPASSPVAPSFFDDAVFVGDSITLKMSTYAMGNNTFSNASFLCSGSLGIANAMWEVDRPGNVHPMFQGQIVTAVDGVARSGCSKVYLMLGMNDIGLYGVQDTFENFKTFTADILNAAPHATLYIQSVTPMYFERGSLNNNAICEYNALISEYCREKGWYYIDVASALRGADGSLPLEYCSDPDPSVGGQGIHFTDTACQIWADYLYTHTGT